ncbi:Ig-like domain-containing protein [Candidatus Sulfurimonas marisnigri]|uniref:Ig-like domain-containing protein n=1 Tax=Candidatus Sulfurimonas marisnigri TaxID=2740405 RepID=A0A7S7LZT2_9BACT|nr:Ig-like domain-containing protein [Candidatus Sulfurimonas marisnigri]QOY54436.1 Ig-like domain-containing protein [Candidatus Sulfurimonas marisnigri]
MIRSIIISFLILFSLTGCGEGDGSGTVTGQFVDAPVQGLGYTCSSGTTGTTNSNGEYTCIIGDSVTFFIGSVEIGTSSAQETAITPYSLFTNNNVAAINLARLLQSVDTGSVSGVIVIDTALEANIPADTNFSNVDFNTTIQDALDIVLVSETEARTTMNEAIIIAGGIVPADVDSNATQIVEEETSLFDFDEIQAFVAAGISTVGQAIADEYYKYAWHIEDHNNNFTTSNGIDSSASVNIKSAWEITRGQGVLVAVIDDSFNTTHEDLKDNIVATYNAKTGSSIVFDSELTSAHGTAVSGIVGASANNKGVVGVAPDAKLLLIAIGEGENNSDLTLIDAFEYARIHGAHVVSCSWGTESVSEAVSVKIKELYDDGITVVFASGNLGKDLDSEGISDESELPWVIGVGASSETNNKTQNSNYGKNIDILAPSGNNIGIVTTDEMGYTGRNGSDLGIVNKNYTFLKGTSASAPIVSGVVALLLSEKPDLSPAQIRHILINSTDKIGDVTYNENGWNSQYAYGKINAHAALLAIGDVPASVDITVEEAEVTNADPDRVEVDVEYRGSFGWTSITPGLSTSSGSPTTGIELQPTFVGRAGQSLSSSTVTNTANASWVKMSTADITCTTNNTSCWNVPLSYSSSGRDITVTFPTSLTMGTTYRIRFTTSISGGGDNLSSNRNYYFTTISDSTPPTLTSVSMASNNSADSTKARPTNQITVTFTANEALDVGATTATIAGQSATIALVSGTTYTAKYTMTTATNNGNIAFLITARDTAGNAASAVSTTTDGSSVTFDKTGPTVNTPISPASGATLVAKNTTVVFTFNEAMDASTLTTSNISMDNGVTGSVGVSGNTVTFTPSVDLADNTTYTLTVTTGVKDALGNAIASNFTSSFSTVLPESVPPVVSSTNPADGASGVDFKGNVQVTFNETMNASTINTTNIRLLDGATPISGSVSLSGNTATFIPDAYMDFSKTYTIRVETGVQDASANNLASTFTSTFTTQAPETTPPTISSISPANNEEDVVLNSAVTITFSEEMKASTITTSNIIVKDSNNDVVAGTVSLSNNVATFTPTANYAIDEVYSVRVTTGVQDLSANGLASQSDTIFTTVASACTQTANPTICYSVPEDDAISVLIDSSISIRFSEAMVAGGMSTSNIVLRNESSTSIPGTVTYDGYTATFTPSSSLTYNHTYTINVNGGVVGATTSNGMGSQATRTFTTAVDSSGDNVRDNTKEVVVLGESSLVWQDDADVLTTKTWSSAKTYCADSTLGGYDDWYLPDVNELKSLADEIDEDESIFQNIVSGYFWSSETYSGDSNRALDVRFNNGSVNHYGKLNSDYVRCVRSSRGSEAGADEADIPSGIVNMNSTALVWQDNNYNTKTNWQSAVDYCTGLSLATFTDWRLPTITELESIVDRGDEGTTPFLNSVFQTGEMDIYWSSTSVERPTTDVKYLDFYSGDPGTANKTTGSGIARCVRNK